MSVVRRRCLLLLGTMLLLGGCNPLMLPLLLSTINKQATVPAEYQSLASEDKKKDVKVVILTHMPLTFNNDFIQADREIARLLSIELKKLTQDNEEKVTIVNPMKVEEYKSSNPDWSSTHLDLEAVGKHFKVDYVVYIEIGSLSMYQPGSIGTFYRGQANLTVSLYNVKKPDDFLPPREIQFNYPPESQGGNRAVDSDTPPQLFRNQFLASLSRKLAGLFSARPTNERTMGE